MLIATAGHVDHGKTALVQRLTGVDTDRLPEEKARGVSIDLGFAYTKLGAAHVDTDSDQSLDGFIDVPGHERFVRNMLAGVGAIDAALLVIAADDGPMPQTREHLAILDLLGIATGVIAITKSDLVDATRLAEVTTEIQALCAHTSLREAAIVAVSAHSGAGIDTLRTHLSRLRETHQLRSDDGRFRLAIDRHFTVPGAGLVVTGTVFSGQVRVGETVTLSPAGVPLRIRSLHAQNRAADIGVAGQRCALNLAGNAVRPDIAKRGDWLVGDPAPIPTRRFDAQVRVLVSEANALAHWTPIHVHIGAASLTGRVAVLEGKDIKAGSSALAQFVLDQPTLAVHGDRFIVRDQSAQRTIAGGTVIDPFGAVKGRARPERLAWLHAMQGNSAAGVLSALLEQQGMGIDLAAFGQARNLPTKELTRIGAELALTQVEVRGAPRVFLTQRWQALCDQIIDQLAQWHRAHPEQAGPTQLELRRIVQATGQSLPTPTDFPAVFVDAAVATLSRAGTIRRHGATVRLPDHEPRLSQRDQQLWQLLSPHLGPDQFQPPVVSELAKRTATEKPILEDFLHRAALRGQLTPVAPNRYLHPSAVYSLARIAEQLGEGDDAQFDAKTFRDTAGIGRNLTIELLEFFDAHRFTRRLGNSRRILRASEEVFGIASH